MAYRAARQTNTRYVTGNLAHDYGYLERERQRERSRRAGREEVRRRTSEPSARRRVEAAPKRRARVRVSPAAVLGFAVAAAMAMALLMSYAQLTGISNQVVRQRRVLAALQEEHVKLVARYEKTFDLTTIKEAAESAGMAKPSSSQIYYIDLSEPDSIVLHQKTETTALSRVAGSVGEDVAAIVEYFK